MEHMPFSKLKDVYKHNKWQVILSTMLLFYHCSVYTMNVWITKRNALRTLIHESASSFGAGCVYDRSHKLKEEDIFRHVLSIFQINNHLKLKLSEIFNFLYRKRSRKGGVKKVGILVKYRDLIIKICTLET